MVGCPSLKIEDPATGTSAPASTTRGAVVTSISIWTVRSPVLSWMLWALAQPGVLITDKLRSYAEARAEISSGIEHRQHKGLNNRAEASHRHTRRREKIMGRFKSPRRVQRFLSVHDQTAALFCPKRHRLSAKSCRDARADAFELWGGYALQ